MFVKMIRLRVEQKRWGAPELAYAAIEIPFDAVVSDKLRFNRLVMPADFERIIDEHRQMRRRLSLPMTVREKRRLIERYGPSSGQDEIDPASFHICDFDRDDQPLYRYAPPPRRR